MHVAIAGGHSARARGASGYIDEYDEDRAFTARLVEAFDRQGWGVTDCSNDAATVNGELQEECRAANASGADLFVAVHFNAGGGTGTEVWHYPGSSAEGYARDVSRELAAALGLRDRGAKSTTGLYVLNRTEMPAILIEVCFVDAAADAGAWRAASWDQVVGAVVRGLGGEYESEEEDMTDEQARQLEAVYRQQTGTCDPTGRGVELNDHDHIKWIGAKVTDTANAVADLAKAVAALAGKVDEMSAKAGD